MTDYKLLLRSTFFKALLPQIILVFVIVFLHWILLSIWFYINYEEMEEYKLGISSLIGGLTPVFVYGIWGFRRFIIRTYRVLHEQIIAKWVEEFSNKTADRILNSNVLKELEKTKESISYKFSKMLRDKTENFPKLAKKLIAAISRRIPLSDEIDQSIRLVEEKNQSGIATRINDWCTDVLFETSENIIPTWTVYLVVVDIILMIALWFL